MGPFLPGPGPLSPAPHSSGLASGPTTYNQALSGALSFAGAAPTFAMQRTLATAALSFVGSAPLALVARLLTGSITPNGVITRASARRVTAALTPSGALTRAATRLITATLHPTSALLRSATRQFAAALTPVGSLTTVRLYGRVVAAAALSFVGGAQLYPDPLLYPGNDQYPFGGAILFQLNRALAAAQRPVGLLGTHAAQARLFSAVLAPSVVFVRATTRHLTISATLMTTSFSAQRLSRTFAQALFSALRNTGALSTAVNPGLLYPGGGGWGVPMPDSYFQRYKPTLRRQRMKV